MMKLKKSSFLLFLISINLCFVAYARETQTKSMHDLCKIADSDSFNPLPASVRSPNPNPLFRAIEFGEKKSTLENLLAGQNPDLIVISDMTPMHMAALTGNWAAAKVLLDAGANINHQYTYSFGGTTTPLAISMLTNQFAFACKLIEHEAILPLNKKSRDELLGSALVMKPEYFLQGSIFIDFLMENGFDVNDYGNSLETPLTASIALNNIPTIKILLKHGARLDIIKKDGRTAWTVAFDKNNPRVLKLLKEAKKKADVTKNLESKALVR